MEHDLGSYVMTADDLVIRKAEKADADAVFALAREFGLTFRPEREAFDEALPALLHDEDTLLIAAVADGRVQGYLLGNVHLTLFANGPVAWVEEAYANTAKIMSEIGVR